MTLHGKSWRRKQRRHIAKIRHQAPNRQTATVIRFRMCSVSYYKMLRRHKLDTSEVNMQEVYDYINNWCEKSYELLGVAYDHSR